MPPGNIKKESGGPSKTPASGGSSGSFKTPNPTPPPKSKTPAPASPPARPASSPPQMGGMVAGAAAGAAAAGEEFRQRLDMLQFKCNNLADEVVLTSQRQAVEDLRSSIFDLAGQVQSLRARGYRYKNYLEPKLDALQQKWSASQPILQREIDAAQRDLRPAYDQLARRLSTVTNPGQADAFERELDNLNSRITAATRTVENAFQNINDTYQQTAQQVGEAVALMDGVDQASFELLAGETPIQSVPAKWWRDGKNEGPEGVLYVTDQRLLFEQKEKVATKKVLFITTESETVQQLLLANPVGAIESCKASSAGLGGNQDHLDFAFTSGDFANAHFHIKGQESDAWAALIKRILNGDIASERYYAEGEDVASVQQAAESALANAPVKCTACGAPIDEQITRGQHQVQCEYCGTVMRW